MNPGRFVTVGVLASAYPAKLGVPGQPMLTHTVLEAERGVDGAALCGQRHLSDASDDESAPPTCRTCRAKNPRFQVVAGDTVLAVEDGERTVGKVVATSPRTLTVQFYGAGGYGHRAWTFSRATGLPTGDTLVGHPNAALDLDFQSPFAEPRTSALAPSPTVSPSRSMEGVRRSTASRTTRDHAHPDVIAGRVGMFKLTALGEKALGPTPAAPLPAAPVRSTVERPTRSKKPWQVSLLVIDPARPGLRTQ